MRANELLTSQITSVLDAHIQTLSSGEYQYIDITMSAEIENGEDIIGYQYLHGTNADAGGLRICGTVGRDATGTAIYDVNCTWNDIIDPNFNYDSDRKKAALANLIIFSNPSDYKISITWRMENNKRSHSRGGGPSKGRTSMLY